MKDTNATNINDEVNKPHNISDNLWKNMDLNDSENFSVKIFYGSNNKTLNDVKAYLMKSVSSCVGDSK